MSVSIEDLKGVRGHLTEYLKGFRSCMKRKCNRAHLRVYVQGQISDLDRKSVEPIALAAGVAPRTLQEFLGIHLWDHEAMRRRVQRLVMRDHADDNAIAIIDETSFVKQGDKTAGVQRQYCGTLGKKDNCVVTVHVGYAAGDFHALIDGDLFLPEASWDGDRARCREAGIPDEVRYRPKWQIALDRWIGRCKTGSVLGIWRRMRAMGASRHFGRAWMRAAFGTWWKSTALRWDGASVHGS